MFSIQELSLRIKADNGDEEAAQKLAELEKEWAEKQAIEDARSYITVEYTDDDDDLCTWETDYPDNDALKLAWEQWTALSDTARFAHFDGDEPASIRVDRIVMVYPHYSESEVSE